MQIFYTWSITNLERLVSDGFVFKVDILLTALGEEDNKIYRTTSNGSIILERPEILVPYESLTEELVLGWIKEKLTPAGVADAEDLLMTELEGMVRPIVGSGLPWQLKPKSLSF